MKIVEEQDYIAKAQEVYSRALEEWERAEKKKDLLLLRDACGKGWLATLEATKALLLKKGLTEEALPSSDRGRRYLLFKHAEKELRRLYLSLRESLHRGGSAGTGRRA